MWGSGGRRLCRAAASPRAYTSLSEEEMFKFALRFFGPKKSAALRMTVRKRRSLKRSVCERDRECDEDRPA